MGEIRYRVKITVGAFSKTKWNMNIQADRQSRAADIIMEKRIQIRPDSQPPAPLPVPGLLD